MSINFVSFLRMHVFFGSVSRQIVKTSGRTIVQINNCFENTYDRLPLRKDFSKKIFWQIHKGMCIFSGNILIRVAQMSVLFKDFVENDHKRN